MPTAINIETLTLPAPAKLNLMLHIVGRRHDGYHLLQTQFQLLDFCDQLTFRKSKQTSQNPRIKLTTQIPGVDAADNLVTRAAHRLILFCREKGFRQPLSDISVQLDKKIPMGGGLGGGSSDAATTLLGLNHIWQLGCSIDELAKIGLALGADVPVFVRGFAAWAEGVGEKLTPIEPKEVCYLVICPECHISTQEIFCHPELTRDTEIMTITRALDQGGHNDCESIAKATYQEVAQALDWLSQYGKSQMTGTGACIFAGFNDQESAEAVLAALPDHWQGFIAWGKNRSPLHEALAI
ncbi:4-(cytidine 5'-diphospho)-2-C-methyl-D-erythritol kinase [Oceanospirillum linum]|uniref:4-diphosphocytidyl-2-C-methyl-D-erythritol kinase n=1 Tax=Oceanospirillum linum TaxID=966 RepID=A0A1T1H9A0_OCELI|nr:4-(cytidine 5'-diphospho)-2-C-methyl-D-erythritol kinase [Oceanospirillum linum]OOV86449.1 4-(cytidine 5'-diphospho)-2-C-methyl-D-erythritol kinase [Oceanospirillum linum]SEG33682.1 4-diphosphocytidyl-2-C-methyl-D-erythritol kinase [Oleiphilus messinensis]SMP29396.1 4-diphosphocytidyl-2-C-methyl-D-erythritol kinase [Oceanospirillum linum]